jgi:hypothetical protein
LKALRGATPEAADKNSGTVDRRSVQNGCWALDRFGSKGEQLEQHAIPAPAGG